MVPTWLESWWSTPPAEAWDITHANSFYRANPTATLMWIFTAWRHDVILGLLMFAVLTGVLVFAFLLVLHDSLDVGTALAHLCNRRGAAGSPGIRDADLNELTRRQQKHRTLEHSCQPTRCHPRRSPISESPRVSDRKHSAATLHRSTIHPSARVARINHRRYSQNNEQIL